MKLTSCKATSVLPVTECKNKNNLKAYTVTELQMVLKNAFSMGLF